jgi:anti-sigma B factor antagonist
VIAALARAKGVRYALISYVTDHGDVSSGANAVSLSIRTGTQGDRTFVIALRGEVDYTTAQQFREEVSTLLAGGDIRVLVIDLKEVSFLDSTGVGTLVVASRICTDFGVRMLLRDVNPFIARLFSVLGVSDVLGVPAPAGVVAPRRGTPAQRPGGAVIQPA